MLEVLDRPADEVHARRDGPARAVDQAAIALDLLRRRRRPPLQARVTSLGRPRPPRPSSGRGGGTKKRGSRASALRLLAELEKLL